MVSDGCASLSGRIDDEPGLVVAGRLRRVVGLTIEAVGCTAALGERCDVVDLDGRVVETEVVGFAEERLFLMPTRHIDGLRAGARVIPRHCRFGLTLRDELRGRVLDGRGEPIDGRGRIGGPERSVPASEPINPLERLPITEPLDVGVRSINALTTLGRGQRVGLFAGSGVGKSMLLAMMTRHTDADVVVVGLIGERGREVSEFVNETLGEAALGRAVVVATPADEPPLMRLNGAWLATSIASIFATGA